MLKILSADCSWEFTGTEEEGTKSIPYQLQRLFLQLQVSVPMCFCKVVSLGNLLIVSICCLLGVYQNMLVIMVCMHLATVKPR